MTESRSGEKGSSQIHELATFLQQDAAEMRSEYDRIRARTKEDPGTAGDEGEEVWAAFLRDWLPESYQIVTKGRLLATDGRASPQLDLIVLRPGYPKRLVNKKLYLTGGVAAAFECKNTLTAEHVRKSFEQARAIDELIKTRRETPFAEIVPSIFFGLLAHSTSWRSEPDLQCGQVDVLLHEGLMSALNIRHCPSLVCVADLQCWSALRMTYDGPGVMPAELWDIRRTRGNLPPEGVFTLQYSRFVRQAFPEEQAPFNSLSAAVAVTLGRLAHDDAASRPLSQYFFASGLHGSAGAVASRAFPISDYSASVRSKLLSNLVNGETGSDWSFCYLY